jgi:hypothetical protein
MTPGAPAAEDVLGQLAAMRVIPVVVLDDSALCCPSTLVLCSGTSEALPDLPGWKIHGGAAAGPRQHRR